MSFLPSKVVSVYYLSYGVSMFVHTIFGLLYDIYFREDVLHSSSDWGLSCNHRLDYGDYELT